MAPDHPTASITGRHEWTWNQAQTERQAEPAAVASQTARPLMGSPAIREQNEERDADLSRAPKHPDWQLQQVIIQYERLLAERDRQIERLEQALSEENKSSLERAWQALRR